MAKVTSRTKLALIDHVTSPSAFVLPIAAIIQGLEARGVDTLVDGAHAPGQLAVSLSALRPAYYTANCHKWMCAPKGAAFLYVRRDRQAAIHPLSTSHGMNIPAQGTSRFRLEFDWTGTDDPTPYLCVPEAIRFLAALMPDVQARNRKLAADAVTMLCARFGFVPSAPESMRAAMGAMLLPGEASAFRRSPLDPDPLQDWLASVRKIEVPVTPLPSRNARMLRISAHAHNGAADYERLADALASASHAR
jgi:isopenicillin-N epimerase